MTKITLVTGADLGNKKNLKTAEANAIINSFKKNKINYNILCRAYSGTNNKKIRQIAPLGNIIPKIFTLLDEITFKKFNFRKINNQFLDFFASKKINKTDAIIFLPYSFEKTCEIAKQKKIKTINIGTSASNTYVSKLKNQELKHTHKIKKNKNVLSNLSSGEKSLKKCDHIITYSKYCKRTYEYIGIKKSKIIVLDMGTKLNKFKPLKTKLTQKNIKNKKFRVVCVANYTILKGLKYLIEAWINLKLENAELILIGKLDKEVQNQLKKYKLPKNIKFLGFVDPLAHYQNSTIFVLPTLTEGFAKVVLEAMSCGLPVITTTNSGADSAIKQGKEGFIIPIRDSKKIEETIQYFYNNPKKTKEMNKLARKTAMKYSWDRYSNSLAKTINKLMK